MELGFSMLSERWLSVTEISIHLGVSKETVYRWLEKRFIPSHRIGKLWKFKASEVDEWVMSGGANIIDPDKLTNVNKERNYEYNANI